MHESFFFSAPVAIILFLYGAGWNIYIFKKYNISLCAIFNVKQQQLPTAKGLWSFATFCLVVFAFIYPLHESQVFAIKQHPEVLVGMFYVLLAIIITLPFNVLHYECRKTLFDTIKSCLWPFRGVKHMPLTDTPFLQVYIADGLTSLSKMLQDITVVFMLLMLYAKGEHDTDEYKTQLRHHPLPYFVASLPYLIRAQQCAVSYRLTKQSNDQHLHLLNGIKYVSGLLVIGIGSFPRIYATQAFDAEGLLFLLAACFNSMYSFVWDVVMDWGLFHPQAEVIYLRPTMLYPRNIVYYMAIFMDLILRILWVTKWWEWQNLGADFKFIAEISEVCRRVVWNMFRVEWQSLKRNACSSTPPEDIQLPKNLSPLAALEHISPETSPLVSNALDSTEFL